VNNHKTRIKTLRVLLHGNNVMKDSARISLIIGELECVKAAKKISDEPRGRLLQILHATRALDSSLRSFIEESCAYLTVPIIPPIDYSLGSYLVWFVNHDIPSIPKMQESQRLGFQNRIVKERNRYVHQAGAFPSNDGEVAQLLTEMDTCLSIVLGS